MKTKALVAILVSTFVFFMVNTAQAEFLHLSAGIPVQYNFSDSDYETDSISGTMFHASIPLFPGLGIENYDIKMKDNDNVSDTSVNMMMYDIFYLFPIPIVNFSAGVGMGQVKVDCDSCSDYFDSSFGNATQWYLQLGIPIIPLFDIHLSYHNVTAKVEASDNAPAGFEDVDLGGTMYGIGVAFTF